MTFTETILPQMKAFDWTADGAAERGARLFLDEFLRMYPTSSYDYDEHTVSDVLYGEYFAAMVELAEWSKYAKVNIAEFYLCLLALWKTEHPLEQQLFSVLTSEYTAAALAIVLDAKGDKEEVCRLIDGLCKHAAHIDHSGMRHISLQDMSVVSLRLALFVVLQQIDLQAYTEPSHKATLLAAVDSILRSRMITTNFPAERKAAEELRQTLA